jgi:hypothetical protein
VAVDSQDRLKIGSWAVVLFPFIEQTQLSDAWNDQNRNAQWSQNAVDLFPDIPGFVCPTDITNDDEQTAKNSYAINVGFFYSPLTDSKRTSPILGYLDPLVSQANVLKATRKENSMSHNAAGVSVGFNSSGLKSAGIRDGSSNTLHFAENLQADGWSHYSRSDDSIRHRLGFGYLYRSDLPDSTLVGSKGQQVPPDDLEPVNRINGEKMLIDQSSPLTARPSSAHSGGIAIVAFADSSIRKLADTMDYHVYQSLVTPITRGSDAPFTLHLLKAADYE